MIIVTLFKLKELRVLVKWRDALPDISLQ